MLLVEFILILSIVILIHYFIKGFLFYKAQKEYDSTVFFYAIMSQTILANIIIGLIRRLFTFFY